MIECIPSYHLGFTISSPYLKGASWKGNRFFICPMFYSVKKLIKNYPICCSSLPFPPSSSKLEKNHLCSFSKITKKICMGISGFKNRLCNLSSHQVSHLFLYTVLTKKISGLLFGRSPSFFLPTLKSFPEFPHQLSQGVL